MIDASRVTKPSRSGFAPKPTQQLIVDSVTFTPASTASRADPFRLSTSQAPLFAAIPVSHVEMTTGCPVTAAALAGAATARLPVSNPNEPNKEDCKNHRLFTIIYHFFINRSSCRSARRRTVFWKTVVQPNSLPFQPNACALHRQNENSSWCSRILSSPMRNIARPWFTTFRPVGVNKYIAVQRQDA